MNEADREISATQGYEFGNRDLSHPSREDDLKSRDSMEGIKAGGEVKEQRY